MPNIVDWILGRRQVEYEQDEGLDLAVQTVGELRGRTFIILPKNWAHN